MGFEIALTLFVIVIMLYLLVTEKMTPLVIFFLGVNIFLLTGIINIDEAIAGFSNKGVLTIAVIFIITAAARNSGALDFIASKILKKQKSYRKQLIRIFIPTSTLSAFINNTPVVATIASIFVEWARKNNISVSKYLIPISYVGIFGGICTLIGTSTNLVISGLLEQFGEKPFGMFEITPIGLPLAFIGMIYLFLFGKYFLPDRKTSFQKMENKSKEYTIEMLVEKGSEIANKSVENAGLRNLTGVYLVGLFREGKLYSPINTEKIIHEGDILLFTGKIDLIDDLLSIKGLKLKPLSDQLTEEFDKEETSFYDAVISLNSPLVDKTPKEVNFRENYNAVILAVSRKGKRVVKKIGDITFKPGDTLFLLADTDFKEYWERGNDFFYIANRDNKIKLKSGNSIFIGILLGLVILLGALNVKPLLFLGSIATALIVLSKKVSMKELSQAVDMKILLLLVFAFAVGKAIENSGTAKFLANQIFYFVEGIPIFWVFVILYFFVMVLTEVITNNSAAVITLPIALRLAGMIGVESHKIAIIVAIAASASFLTPIGYQTNLIVYGLGNYKFSDFFKIGLPLSLIFMFSTSAIMTFI